MPVNNRVCSLLVTIEILVFFVCIRQLIRRIWLNSFERSSANYCMLSSSSRLRLGPATNWRCKVLNKWALMKRRWFNEWQYWMLAGQGSLCRLYHGFLPLKFLSFGANSCKVKVFGSTPSSQLLKDKNELCKKKKNFLDLEQKHFRWRYSLRVELWQH